MKNDGGSAFAAAGNEGWQTGMTLRQWYAGQALPAFLAGGAVGHLTDDLNQDNAAARRWIAIACFEFADAMLAAEATEQPQDTGKELVAAARAGVAAIAQAATELGESGYYERARDDLRAAIFRYERGRL